MSIIEKCALEWWCFPNSKKEKQREKKNMKRMKKKKEEEGIVRELRSETWMKKGTHQFIVERKKKSDFIVELCCKEKERCGEVDEKRAHIVKLALSYVSDLPILIHLIVLP